MYYKLLVPPSSDAKEAGARALRVWQGLGDGCKAALAGQEWAVGLSAPSAGTWGGF